MIQHMARTYPHCLCASTWNTSIDSIVPLPVDLDSLPPAPYAVGTRVLALYPDTSCFYWATIQGGGPAMNGSVPRSKVLICSS